MNVLIQVGVEVVERRLVAGVSIGFCEINRDGKVDGASVENVLKERVRVLSLACFNFDVSEGYCTLVSDAHVYLLFVRPQLRKSHLKSSQVPVEASQIRAIVEVDLELPLIIIRAKILFTNLHLIPPEYPFLIRVQILRLVDGNILGVEYFGDDEEASIVLDACGYVAAESRQKIERYHLFVFSAFFFRFDHDLGILRWPLFVD